MNIFATLEEIEEFKEIKYYSIKIIQEEDDIDNNKPNEFEKFVLKFENHPEEEIKDEYEVIVAIIEHLGENSKDLIYMRSENSAFALPTKRKSRIKAIEVKLDSRLRLYCVLVNDSVVILCNGDIKTANQVQNSPNVLPHFRLANKLADTLIKNKHDFRIGEKLIQTLDDAGFYL